MTYARQLVTAIIELALASSGKEPEEVTLGVYAKYLSRFDLAPVLAAIDKLILTAKFFPSVGEIVEAMGESRKLEAARAWATVTCGARSAWTPAMQETVRLIGGLNILRLTHIDKMPFVERRFLELYEDIADRTYAMIPPPNVKPRLVS